MLTPHQIHNIESRNSRIAGRPSRIEQRIIWCQKMLFARSLLEQADETRRKHDDLYETHHRVHSNFFDQRYDLSDYRGQLVSPGGDDSGMTDNEPLWTAGHAMTDRDNATK